MSNYYCLPKGDKHGWGVCGTNLAAEFDKLGMQEIKWVGYPQCVKGGVVEAVEGVTLTPSCKYLWGYKSVGVAFIEDDILARRFAPNAGWYTAIACGSSHMRAEMDGIMPDVDLASIPQGVDASIFKPSVLKTSAGLPLVIGSFGKFEYRKGQDIVIEAFKRIRAEYTTNVVLSVNWFNPWYASATSMHYSPYLNPVSVNHMANFQNDWENSQFAYYEQLLMMNGLPRESFIVNRPVSNGPLMADKYRSCDVCVFPSRKEAGTNLPLMEAMACGVPCAYILEHGHKDLFIEGTNAPFHGKKFVHMLSDGTEMGHYYEPSVDAVAQSIYDAVDIHSPNEPLKGESLRKFTERFSWAQTAESIVAMLNR